MISRQNEKSIKNIFYVITTMFIIDLIVIISNIYIAPILNGYGMPDIIIYIKFLSTLLIFVLLLAWLQKKHFKLGIKTLRFLLATNLTLVVVYAFSLYLYKYSLIDSTIQIIQNNILSSSGNNALIYDYSRINLRTLTYVLNTYAGLNSELVLLIQALVLQRVLFFYRFVEIEPEKEVVYDDIYYSRFIQPISYISVILAFLNINLFVSRYKTLPAIEMGIGLTIFIITIMISYLIRQINKTTNLPTTKSFFVKAHKNVLYLLVAQFVLTVALIAYNVYLYAINAGNYRLTSTILILIAGLYITHKIVFALKIENK